MFSMLFFVVITCLFSINVNIKGNRLSAYLIMAVLMVWFVYFCKKSLKPLFDGIGLKSEKPPKDNFFAILLLCVGLFAGGMFAIARLAAIYLCG